MTAENTSQDGLDEALDYAITHYVNRGLIHEDRWTDLKAALKRLLLQERLSALTELMNFGTDTGAFKVGSRGIRKHEIKTRIATLSAQLSKNEMGEK